MRQLPLLGFSRFIANKLFQTFFFALHILLWVNLTYPSQKENSNCYPFHSTTINVLSCLILPRITLQLYLTSSYKKCTIKYKLGNHMCELATEYRTMFNQNIIKSVFVPIIVLHAMPPSWLPLSQNNRTICWWVDKMYLLTFLFNMLQMTPFIDTIKIVLSQNWKNI